MFKDQVLDFPGFRPPILDFNYITEDFNFPGTLQEGKISTKGIELSLVIESL